MLNNSNSSSKNHNGASNNCSTGSSGRNASAAAAERERDSVVEIRRGRGGGGGGGGGNGHGRSSRDEAAGGGSSSSNNATSSNTGAPCGACKFLRRKCVSDCVFAPYFGTDQGAAKFAAVHKVFGASNVSKLLLHQVPVHRRHEAVFSICYEAQARLQDPIFGCVSQIFSLNQQIQALQAELRVVQEQMNAMQQQHHHNLAMNMNMGMNFLQSPHQQQHLLYGDIAAMNMNLHNPNMGCSSSSPALRIISDNRDLQSMNMNLHNPNMASSSSSGGGLRIMSGQSPPTAPYPRLNIRDTPIATAAAAQSSPIIPFDMDLSASPLENLHRQHRGGVGIANEDEDAPTSSEDPAAELAFAHSFFHPRK